MLESLQNFFYMGGHGIYVFSAYGTVCSFLLVQWFLAWQRWRLYRRDHE